MFIDHNRLYDKTDGMKLKDNFILKTTVLWTRVRNTIAILSNMLSQYYQRKQKLSWGIYEIICRFPLNNKSFTIYQQIDSQYVLFVSTSNIYLELKLAGKTIRYCTFCWTSDSYRSLMCRTWFHFLNRVSFSSFEQFNTILLQIIAQIYKGKHIRRMTIMQMSRTNSEASKKKKRRRRDKIGELFRIHRIIFLCLLSYKRI